MQRPRALRDVSLSSFIVACVMWTIAIPPADARDDWQLWLEQRGSVKLSPTVKLVAKAEERFRDDMRRYYFQVGSVWVSWKALPWLKLEPGYHHQWSEARNGSDAEEHRLFLAATPGWSVGRFHMEDRSRIEFRHIDGVDDWRYRNKGKLNVEVGARWYACEPFVADEVFYGARAGEWTRNRFSIGIEKPLTKELSTELYYLIESNRRGRDWDAFHVLGVVMDVAL